jgi:ParB/RepB/Spo0J family partition protein
MSSATLLESTAPREGRKISVLRMDEIIADLPGFNCRGKIDPRTCIQLAQEIKEKGLLFPVIVRPFHDPIDYPGKKWALVAGYRRHMAHVINRAEEIEGEIRYNLTEADAAILNLTENLEREDLNIMQEARAFGRLRNRVGLSTKTIAEKLHRSVPWVEIRMMALELEPAIQSDIEKGMLTQNQIKDIHSLPEGEPRFAAVRMIKSAKLRGDKRKIQIGTKKPRNIHSKKRREPHEIFEMQDHMLEEFGNGSLSRCPFIIKKMIQILGWAAAEASDLEIYTSLREIAEQEGYAYSIPDDALSFLKT